MAAPVIVDPILIIPTTEDFEKLLSGSVEQPADKDEEMLTDLLTTKHKLKVDEKGEFTVFE